MPKHMLRYTKKNQKLKFKYKSQNKIHIRESKTNHLIEYKSENQKYKPEKQIRISKS